MPQGAGDLQDFGTDLVRIDGPTAPPYFLMASSTSSLKMAALSRRRSGSAVFFLLYLFLMTGLWSFIPSLRFSRCTHPSDALNCAVEPIFNLGASCRPTTLGLLLMDAEGQGLHNGLIGVEVLLVELHPQLLLLLTRKDAVVVPTSINLAESNGELRRVVVVLGGLVTAVAL